MRLPSFKARYNKFIELIRDFVEDNRFRPVSITALINLAENPDASGPGIDRAIDLQYLSGFLSALIAPELYKEPKRIKSMYLEDLKKMNFEENRLNNLNNLGQIIINKVLLIGMQSQPDEEYISKLFKRCKDLGWQGIMPYATGYQFIESHTKSKIVIKPRISENYSSTTEEIDDLFRTIRRFNSLADSIENNSLSEEQAITLWALRDICTIDPDYSKNSRLVIRKELRKWITEIMEIDYKADPQLDDNIFIVANFIYKYLD